MTVLNPSISQYDYYTNQENMLKDVIQGLTKPEKQLSAKYLYDQKGSALFESITNLPEYYPTRTELAIFQENAEEMRLQAGNAHTIVEYGSGSSKKIQKLISLFHELNEYLAIDISKEFLYESCLELAKLHPDLTIKAVCGDYTHKLPLPVEKDRKKIVFFPGSTIGNFEPEEAQDFLRNTAESLSAGDGLIIGVDTKKDRSILEQAYDDAQGVTAAFNLNLLERLNRELHADFQLEQFEHKAVYNEVEGRIEMHLRSLTNQQVTIAGQPVVFAQGETIHTENSYKYSPGEFQHLASQCLFTPIHVWTDEDELFSVHYMEKR